MLVISLSSLTNDARVLRQVAFLAERFDVVVAAPGPAPAGIHAEVIELPGAQLGRARALLESGARSGLRLLGRYSAAYWTDRTVRQWRDRLSNLPHVDAVVVNDLFGLPLAHATACGAPVVFDAHEHWTSESASWTLRQRLIMRNSHEWLVERFVPRSAAIMTVSSGLAREYARRAHMDPLVVTSAPFSQPLTPSEVSEPIRLVHFGVADERRRLEDTIEAVRLLDGRFALDLVLVRDNEYRRHLERLVAGDPLITVRPPVPAAELVEHANAYDVGVFLLPARFPNQVHVLPNKLFDYIQARLAVAIGPSPEMAEVVREWDCGVVSESFSADSFAAVLGTLTTDEVWRFKQNSDRAARTLNAENNRDRVLSLVEGAISNSDAA